MFWIIINKQTKKRFVSKERKIDLKERKIVLNIKIFIIIIISNKERLFWIIIITNKETIRFKRKKDCFEIKKDCFEY